MAMRSSDWSLVPIAPQGTLPRTLISVIIPNILSLASSSPWKRGFPITSSSNAPPPLIDSDVQSIQISPPIPNKFIQDLLRNTKTETLAFDYYRKARNQQDFRPDQKTLNLLVKSLLKSSQWSSISALSDDFETFDVFPDGPISASLIRSCIRAKRFNLAESLLQILVKKKEIAVSAFAIAMRGYNKLHMYRITIRVFERMLAAGLPPSATCYLCIMDAHRKLGNTDTVLSLFHEFESRELGSSAISHRMYLILCESLASSGRAFESLTYFREMLEKGIPPIPLFYASLICSFAGIREAEIAEDLFQEARKLRMLKDQSVFLKFISMYVELGLMEKSIDVVITMKEMSIRVSDCIFATVVNGFAKKRGLRASVRAFERLIGLNCEPGQVTFASIINIYCCLGLSSKAESLFSEMMEKGFDQCVVAYSNMISMYGKLGRSKDAMRLLAKMKQKGCKPNVWVYNSLIDMNGRLMNLRQVEKLWIEMKRKNITPDRISYTSIICAYNKVREFDKCVGFYQEFKSNGGKVDQALAGIMVAVFSNSGCTDGLLELLREMKSDGIELDWRLHRSSLNALRDTGIQVQVEWFERNFEFVKDKT